MKDQLVRKERTSDFKVHGRKRKCVRIQRELTEGNSLTFTLIMKPKLDKRILVWCQNLVCEVLTSLVSSEGNNQFCNLR